MKYNMYYTSYIYQKINLNIKVISKKCSTIVDKIKCISNKQQKANSFEFMI